MIDAVQENFAAFLGLKFCVIFHRHTRCKSTSMQIQPMGVLSFFRFQVHLTRRQWSPLELLHYSLLLLPSLSPSSLPLLPPPSLPSPAQLSLTLDQGIGVSLINSVPEELVFVSVDGLQIQFTSSRDQQCVNLIVQHIQARRTLRYWDLLFSIAVNLPPPKWVGFNSPPQVAKFMNLRIKPHPLLSAHRLANCCNSGERPTMAIVCKNALQVDTESLVT